MSTAGPGLTEDTALRGLDESQVSAEVGLEAWRGTSEQVPEGRGEAEQGHAGPGAPTAGPAGLGPVWAGHPRQPGTVGCTGNSVHASHLPEEAPGPSLSQHPHRTERQCEAQRGTLHTHAHTHTTHTHHTRACKRGRWSPECTVPSQKGSPHWLERKLKGI